MFKVNSDPSKYNFLEKIGQGSYGAVYKATNMAGDELTAVKKIESSKKIGVPSSVLREVSCLKTIQHPNVIKLLNVIYNENHVLMVLEYVEQDFHSFIKKFNYQAPQNLHQLKVHLDQLIKGVQSCHAAGIIHRDIKPANILINKTLDLKIADFGLARLNNIKNERSFSSVIATLWYRAPDVLMGSKKYSSSLDIWSIGCVFAEMLLRKPLFKGKDAQNQLDDIFNFLGTPSEEEWPGLREIAKKNNYRVKECPGVNLESVFPTLDLDGIDLIKKMLDCNPRTRITIEEAFQHNFFECFWTNND